MRTVRQGLVGLFSVVFLLGGVAMVTPLGSVAQAASPAGLIADHDAEMAAQHNMIQQDITDAQTAIQGDLTTLQAAVDALVVSPPCGAGTAGQRFVADTEEVCDNTTGLYWVKMPDATVRSHAAALTHCAGLDLGNSQTYRLPEVKELISLVDYSQFNLALPVGHPFSNVQSSLYWSASTSASNSHVRVVRELHHWLRLVCA